MYFSIYGLQETGLDKCPKSPVSEDPLTSNVINRPKHCWNRNDSTFTYFLIPVKTIQVDIVSPSDMHKFKTVF